MGVHQQSHGSSNKSSKKSTQDEDTTLAQGVVDDTAEVGADNDGDVDVSASSEEPTLRDKEGRLVESDDTKRASGNRSTSQFRQHDQHGNMTRPDDRRRGKGGSNNSTFIRH